MNPPTQPHAQGTLAVGDANTVSWQAFGNPEGGPAICLRGGPGSGGSPRRARFCDPARTGSC